jgi:hypothetical protein
LALSGVIAAETKEFKQIRAKEKAAEKALRQAS